MRKLRKEEVARGRYTLILMTLFSFGSGIILTPLCLGGNRLAEEIERLGSLSAVERASSARQLGKMKREAQPAVGQLIKALNDTSEDYYREIDDRNQNSDIRFFLSFVF